MQRPLVSIITPCYNGEKYLDRYFNSILSQTYCNIELIFVDDGSFDRTSEIAESYREKLENKGIFFVYLYQENAGQAAALNRGLKIFSGKYLTWPDADDEMTPDCIEKKVDFLENNLQFGMCICKFNIIDEKNPKGNRVGMRKKPSEKDNLFEDLIFFKDVFFVPGGYMIRSESLLSVLNNRDIYPGRGGQNYQLLLPMAYYFKSGYMDDVLYNYYIREESHSHSIDDSLKIIRQLKLYEKILLETLVRIGINVYEKYELSVKCHCARLRFGNAIDSRRESVIREEFENLKELKCVSIREKLLYVKATNLVIKKIYSFINRITR